MKIVIGDGLCVCRDGYDIFETGKVYDYEALIGYDKIEVFVESRKMCSREFLDRFEPLTA